MKQVAFQAEDHSHAHHPDNLESGRGGTPSKAKAAVWGRSPRRHLGFTGMHPSTVASLVAAGVVLCCYLVFASRSAFSILALPGLGMHGMHRFGDGTAQTLVIYVYAHTDVEYEDNLQYFLQFGVKPGDGCDYLLVVQEGKGVLDTQLPPLPDNVLKVSHANECYDWGTFGWAIENGMADTKRYRHIIFLNSSVRGPFLPSYWPTSVHWSRVLTDRITDEVKLVGATISCEGANKGGVLSGEMRQNPHVQSYMVATDQTGLALLQKDGRVLRCYSDIHDAIWYSELGSSAAVLQAGYTIDALQLRYQGVDWRDPANWACNAGLNPYAEHMYDGIDVSPVEVMFVKVKEFLLEAHWTTATAAKKYSQWARGQAGPVSGNAYNQHKAELRAEKILRMRARGSACFDFDHYRQRSPDLPAGWGRSQVWEHFVQHGQHEGRVFRFRCKPGQVEGSLAAPAFRQAAADQQQQQHSAAAGAALAAMQARHGGTGDAALPQQQAPVGDGEQLQVQPWQQPEEPGQPEEQQAEEQQLEEAASASEALGDEQAQALAEQQRQQAPEGEQQAGLLEGEAVA